MNKRVEAIVEQARQLSPDEQDELLLQLALVRAADEPADGTPEEIEAAWDAEIGRRIAAHERGGEPSIPHDEVMARLRDRLGRA